MKKLLFAAALSAATLSVTAFGAVSVTVGQPGFYGRVDIGGYSQPQVIYRQPLVVERDARYRTPIYLRVPAYQARHWGRYCDQYDACNAPVYFVQDSWYNEVYVPHYQERHHVRYNEYHDGGRERDRYYRDAPRGDRGERGEGHHDHHGDHHGEGGDHHDD